jgi:uncharacterized protein (DUF4415 family)
VGKRKDGSSLELSTKSSLWFSLNEVKISDSFQQDRQQKPKRGYTVTITSKLKPGEKPDKEQLGRIRDAAKMPIVPDEDSPVYTTEQLAYLYSESKKLNKKRTIGIRLNQKTIDQYKTLGKGYTGIMAAVLDYAINHPNVLKEAL